MKYLLLLIFFSATIQFSIAQVKVGDPVNNTLINPILNAPVTQINTDKLKGKIVWLEFWATWCSPCISAMPNLQQIQKAYKGKLQVITISAESPERIRKFLHNQ